MRHGNAIAIALASVAVVTAGAGTAVAVTSATVITDPSYPARKARIDASGRLTIAGTTTIGTVTTISAISYDYPAQLDVNQPILSPTTASLGITELVYDNSRNIDQANNNVTISLVKIAPGTAGHCYDSDATSTVLRRDGVRQGDSMNSSFAVPILVKATGSKPYCLGTIVRFSSTVAASSYPVSVTIGAYVAGGTYTGAGLPTAATPAKAGPKLRVNR